MDAETALAIAAPSVVAITAIIIGWRQHHDTLEQQRKLADLENVRGVLDDAAELLHRIEYVLRDLRIGLAVSGPDFFDREKHNEAYRALERCHEEGAALRARLAVRLGGDHEAVETFADAREATIAIYGALGLLQLKVDLAADRETSAEDMTRIATEQLEKVSEQIRTYDQRRTDFMAAAQRTAGAELPASRD